MRDDECAVATEHVGQQRTSFHARFINARGIQKLSAQSDCIGNRDRHGFLLAALILYYALYRIGKTVARIGNFRTRRRQVNNLGYMFGRQSPLKLYFG